MEKKFRAILAIKSAEMYEEMKEYAFNLISYSTEIGKLSDPRDVNAYTAEISRVCILCADYENASIKFEYLKVKNPLVLAMEVVMKRKDMNPSKMAKMLDISVVTFSQIMTGKRPISLTMAKRLYFVGIDPKLILENV